MAKTSADYAREYAEMRKKDAQAAKDKGYTSSYNAGPSGYGTTTSTYDDIAMRRDKENASKPSSSSSGSSGSKSGSSSSGNSGNGSSSGYVPPRTTTTTTPPASTVTPTQPEEDNVDIDRMLKEALEAQREAEAERLRKSVEQGVNTLEGRRPELAQQYQSGAQQAYVDKMLAQRDLPQAMAAQGLTGGVHESSLIDLDNTYMNNVNNLRDSYNSALNDIDRDVANIRATGDISIAENSNTYAQKLFDAIQAAKIANQQAQSKYIPSSGGSGSSGAGTDAGSALKTLLKNPFVTRAEARYDPDNQPEKFLDYVSQFVDNAELQQLIAYYGIPKETVDRWIGGAPALTGSYGNMLSDQKRFGVM